MSDVVEYVMWVAHDDLSHDERMALVQSDPARHHAYHSRLVVCDEDGNPLEET